MSKISIDSLFFCLEQLPADIKLEIIEDDNTDGLLIVIPKEIAKDVRKEMEMQKPDKKRTKRNEYEDLDDLEEEG